MQDHATPGIHPDSIKATFFWKLPAFILGILFGFLVVKIAFWWF